jgi:urate oxidase
MGFELGPNRYGKAGIHLAIVVRGEERHEFSEREIEVRLEGDFRDVHVEGDNATVLPTDTMRSAAYALAFEQPAEAGCGTRSTSSTRLPRRAGRRRG